MGVLGNSLINEIYKKYLNTELTYQKQVSASLGLKTQMTEVKLQGKTYPCILHALSFSGAKLILKASPALVDELHNGARIAVVKLSYQQRPTAPVEVFTLSGKYSPQSLQQVGEGNYLLLLKVEYNHRPPEGLIEIQGRYLRLKSDVEARGTQRIQINEESLRILGLHSAHGEIHIDQIPRKCVVKEVSYGGARVLLGGVAKFLDQREFSLSLNTLDQKVWKLPGLIVRAEGVDGHQELSVLGLGYQEEQVPLEYLKAVSKALDILQSPLPPRRSTTSTPQVGYVDTRNLRIKR